MKFILGTKQEMTQIFNENGSVTPVTTVKAGPNFITSLRTQDKDGYKAVQIGFGKRNKITKALAGHLKGLGKFRYLKEIRDEYNDEIKVGDVITVDTFEAGDKIKVRGVSKGRGFQGVVKRHGFAGAPATHGTKDQLRMPGSIGATGPAHVFKGQKMPGQMGNENVTISGLEIIKIDSEKGILYIKGAVPGARNSLLIIEGQGDLKVNIEKEPEIQEPSKEEEVKEEKIEKVEKEEVEKVEKPVLSEKSEPNDQKASSELAKGSNVEGAKKETKKKEDSEEEAPKEEQKKEESTKVEDKKEESKQEPENKEDK